MFQKVRKVCKKCTIKIPSSVAFKECCSKHLTKSMDGEPECYEWFNLAPNLRERDSARLNNKNEAQILELQLKFTLIKMALILSRLLLSLPSPLHARRDIRVLKELYDVIDNQKKVLEKIYSEEIGNGRLLRQSNEMQDELKSYSLEVSHCIDSLRARWGVLDEKTRFVD